MAVLLLLRRDVQVVDKPPKLSHGVRHPSFLRLSPGAVGIATGVTEVLLSALPRSRQRKVAVGVFNGI